MNLSSQAKVGVMVLAAAVILIAIFRLTGGMGFRDTGYEFNIIFDKVEGLPAGTPVRLAGVGVGSVKKIFLDERNRPIVKVKVQEGIRIDANTGFRIVIEGIVGQKVLEVLPKQPPSGDFIEPGSTVTGGASPVSVNDLMSGAHGIIERVGHLVESLDAMVGDEALVSNFRLSAENVAAASEEINKLLVAVNALVADDEVIAAVHLAVTSAAVAAENLSELSASMRDIGDQSQARIIATLDHVQATALNASRLLANANEMLDPPTRANMQELIQHLKEASENIKRMTGSLDEIVSDEHVQADIRETVSTAREMTAKADKAIGSFTRMIEAFNETTLLPSFEMRYIPDLSLTKADMSIRIYPQGSLLYYLMGLDDVGESQETTLQLGIPSQPGRWVRAGIKGGELSIGLDIERPQYVFKADILDPNNLRVNMQVGFQVRPNLYFITGVDDLFVKHYLTLGVEQKY